VPPVPTIYYLNWDSPAADLAAEDRFHEYHSETPEYLTETEFDDLYREVADVETQDLEQLYHEWNYGSRHESQKFVEAEVRSMSVGDVVRKDADYYICAVIGWDELDILDER